MQSQETSSKKLRGDIQALRGWAVLIVVFEHARLSIFPSGFLGVDIFFVISGFLITSIIVKSLRENDFSFGDFYFRRARRILPAAFVTILGTSILSIFSSSSTEIPSLINQIYGSLTYTINFFLWTQVDYFDVAASSKPLLHMWSLAVEEQFYIFLPIILFFTPRKFTIGILLALSLLSFLLCLFLLQKDPASAFYLLPARAWELGIGGILALLVLQSVNMKNFLRLFYYPSLTMIVVIPFLPFSYTHPGLVAALLCLCVAVFIGAERESIKFRFIENIFSKFGDISYSLYLVHWPVMVFFYSGFFGDPPKFLALITIPISLILALAMYHFVEQPSIRFFSKPNRRHFFVVPLATAAVGLVSIGLVNLAKPGAEFAENRLPNYGLDRKCDFSGRSFEQLVECRNGEKPSVFVWGDSYAMHLVPGLAQKATLEQATFSACAPFVGFAPKRVGFKNADVWSDLCIQFNADVFEHILISNQIQTVVMGSPWRLYSRAGGTVLSRNEEGFTEHQTGFEFAVENMNNIVKELVQAGKKVILFGPPPASSVDTSACLERVATGKIIFSNSNCSLDSALASRSDLPIRKFLAEIGLIDGVQIIHLFDTMCDETKCMTQIDGVPLYRDKGHLSVRGSELIFELIELSF